jgi:hypothetical protein
MAFEILMLCIIKDILVQEQLLNDMALEARNNLTRNVPSEDRENPSTTSTSIMVDPHIISFYNMIRRMTLLLTAPTNYACLLVAVHITTNRPTNI